MEAGFRLALMGREQETAAGLGKRPPSPSLRDSVWTIPVCRYIFCVPVAAVVGERPTGPRVLNITAQSRGR